MMLFGMSVSEIMLHKDAEVEFFVARLHFTPNLVYLLDNISHIRLSFYSIAQIRHQSTDVIIFSLNVLDATRLDLAPPRAL